MIGKSLRSEEMVREYLLGRIVDETVLEEFEQQLFTDEEFYSQVALVEDGMINDYVLGRLNQTDAGSFQSTLERDPERRFKVEMTRHLLERALARNLKATKDQPPFFASLAAWFYQPKYIGAIALLLLVVVGLALYFNRPGDGDERAELRSIYRQSRPTETRISDFEYAPLTQLRGPTDPAADKQLRRLENSFIGKTESTPNEQTHQALGEFYVTQHQYPRAIREFESALKFAPQSAKIHNNLGVAKFELSKITPDEKKFEYLAQSLEEFTKATELDSNLLEALFNKSLALQELKMPRQARESWQLYLQKDSSSPWAEEARKNLARIESEQTLLKSDEEVLSDFLVAYRNHDDVRAQRIHNETKGLLRDPAVPLQLSRRYLLAKQRGDDAEAGESIAALTFIGSFEQTQNADSFFAEFANFYAHTGATATERLLQAKDIFASGQRLVRSDFTQAISEFERSRDLFAQLGNTCEAAIAENWAAQFLPSVARMTEGRLRLTNIIANAEKHNFLVLLPPARYWLGMTDYAQNLFSESARNLKTALRLAEATNNTFEIQHAKDALVVNYFKLGELQPALFYGSKMLSDRSYYYQSERQSWRNNGTLADLSLSLGFPSTSFSLSKEALSLAQEVWPGGVQLNDSLRHIVKAANAKRDFEAALRYANESLQIALERGDKDENVRAKAEVYRLLADVKSQTNCREALADYDRALELYTRLPELEVSSYALHKGKLFCFQQLDRQEDFAGELQTVLELTEKYRRTIREDNSRQAFFENEQDVFDAAVAHAIKEGDAQRAFAFVEDSKARSLLEFVKSGKSIAEVEKDFAAVARPLSLAEIQARLPEQVQLLQYAVLPDKLVIWVVSKTRFELFEKQITVAELTNKIETYQASILAKTTTADLKQTAQELYELLIPSDLDSDKQLCVVPDEGLHQLAFATLVSSRGRYLLEDYAVFYAPSVSILVLATENARRKEQIKDESLLSIGNPAFDRDESLDLPDLREAEAEANAIAQNYRKSKELIRGEATKDKFLRSFADFEVIHFAGHFVANSQSPGNSKLLFAEGVVRSSELSDYKWPKAKLAVLSACQTGFERYNKSEGAIGIARTFLALGAPVVLASQWKVDSEPTADLMTAFHRNRRKKQMTAAESLRQAQLEMLSAEKTNAPFYWSAFSLYGAFANY
ncbi:MAG TPA: CHAT domain-containing protein [Pyrinomonadaceae bacterium]